MRHFVESLSVFSGAAVVAALSALLTWPLFNRLNGREIWLVPLIGPLVISYALYWPPVLMGAHDEDQFAAWQLLFIVPWYLAGVVTSAQVALLLRGLQKRKLENRPRNSSIP